MLVFLRRMIRLQVVTDFTLPVGKDNVHVPARAECLITTTDWEREVW